MSSDPESISSPKSIPQWMRSKIENSNFATDVPFSPPGHDESFFYIRYPTGGSTTGASTSSAPVTDQKLSITQKIQAATSGMDTISSKVRELNLEASKTKVDLSKHTEPCRQYLAGENDKSTLRPGQTKPLGIDDGFKSAGCGSSVVRVAHQMVNLNRPFSRGFTVANFDEAHCESDFPDETKAHHRGKSSEPAANRVSTITEEQQEKQLRGAEKNMMRRGSKSLPASPMGSPKAVRKNPYFTGIFTSQNNSSEHNRGWLLSSLLGVQRETTQSTTSSTTNIAEETEFETVEYENGGAFGQKTKPQEHATSITSVFRSTKPSEIREMNFWSPTSM